jgi:hypothetical protein
LLHLQKLLDEKIFICYHLPGYRSFIWAISKQYTKELHRATKVGGGDSCRPDEMGFLV